MKRNCLRVGSLLFLLLALLTILVHRVEVWMLPQVETASIQVEESTSVSYLPLDALGADGSGQGLYQVVQQGGWSEGAVALPVDPGEYTVFPARVVLEICQGPYIRYASKGFRDGDLVEVLSSSREREDEYWLAVFPSGTLSLEEADRTLVVEAQSSGCALFLAQGAQQPFMPGRALAKLFPAQKTPVDCRVYSLAEVEDFFACLPYLCAAAGLAVGALLLWVWSWKLRGRALAWNAAWAAALLVAVFFLLQGVALPSSLLPRGNVFDFSHYTQEFSQIFAAFAEPALKQHSAVQRAQSLAYGQTALAVALVPGGALPALLAAIAGRFLFVRRRTPTALACKA